MVYPTLKATRQTISIAQKHFGNEQSRNTPANAFRHGLWNYLIAQYCYRFRKDQAHVLRWTKTITDWHEDFSPNNEIAREMDLHNNRIGRQVYKEKPQLSLEEVVRIFVERTENAVKVDSLKEIEVHARRFVYLVEFKPS